VPELLKPEIERLCWTCGSYDLSDVTVGPFCHLWKKPFPNLRQPEDDLNWKPPGLRKCKKWNRKTVEIGLPGNEDEQGLYQTMA
jgi:hypothetical protein